MTAAYCPERVAGLSFHLRDKLGDNCPSQMESERRSPRLQLSVRVLVYGRTADDGPFHDITQTLLVSTHGALVPLGTAVSEGQSILLVNCETQAEEKCRVVYVECEFGGQRKVAIAFARQAGNFWGLAYDPKRKVWKSVE